MVASQNWRADRSVHFSDIQKWIMVQYYKKVQKNLKFKN